MISTILCAASAFFIALLILGLCSSRHQKYLADSWKSKRRKASLKVFAAAQIILAIYLLAVRQGSSMGLAFSLVLIAFFAVIAIAVLGLRPQHAKYYLFATLQIWWPSLFFVDWS
ncbi:MAG: DUF3325 family protein [Cellvibrionaceae bacterium]|nr:DUF3325 family protein [Cellvibrionaceae bacterium]